MIENMKMKLINSLITKIAKSFFSLHVYMMILNTFRKGLILLKQNNLQVLKSMFRDISKR